MLVAMWLGVIAVTDGRTGRIPTAVVWPGVVAPLATGICDPQVLLASTLTATPYLLGTLSGRCGGGDVKLAFAIGGVLADAGAGLIAIVLAAIFTLIAYARAPRERRRQPHAPALVAAASCLLMVA